METGLLFCKRQSVLFADESSIVLFLTRRENPEQALNSVIYQSTFQYDRSTLVRT